MSVCRQGVHETQLAFLLLASAAVFSPSRLAGQTWAQILFLVSNVNLDPVSRLNSFSRATASDDSNNITHVMQSNYQVPLTPRLNF